MDMEERLENLAAWHQDAAAAARDGQTLSDLAAEAWQAAHDERAADFWYEEESEAEAAARMTPAERAVDEAYQATFCGLCQELLQPHEKVVCDWCDQMQKREFYQ